MAGMNHPASSSSVGRPSSPVDLSPFRELYPFESHWLDLDGVCYHYLDEGPRDAPPVVMVHGNPTWSFYFRTLIPAISREYRVIVPDHVGCGLSDKPQDYPYHLDQHATNLERLIAHLGLEQVTLLLHDWGAPIGMRCAMRHRENIARFVIMNSSAFYPKGPLGSAFPLRIKIARWPVVGELALLGLNAFAGLAAVMAPHHRERITPQVRAGYVAPYNNWQNRIATLAFIRDVPLERNHRTRPVLEEIDANMYHFRQHPMLFIWGAQDFCFTVDRFLTGWQARFPQAETHVIEDAGHYVVEDAHERIAPWVLDFLARTP